MWQTLKNQIVAKHKKRIFYKTQKLELWHNSKAQIVTKVKNSEYHKTDKLKLWQLKKSNCDKNQKVVMVKADWYLENRWDVLGAALCDSCDVFVRKGGGGWE